MSDELTQGQDSGNDGGGAEDMDMGLDPAYAGAGPKKNNRGPVMIGGLAVLGAGVVWFQFFHKSPGTADASEASTQGAEIRQFLDGDNFNKMRQKLKEADKLVAQFKSSNPSAKQVPLTSLPVNPFRELPPSGDKPLVTNTRDEEREAREAREHEAIVRAVGALRLQSIMLGKRPACMIDNTLYSRGQHVGRFTVEQIDPDKVVLRCGQYRFEVPMQK